MFKPVKIAPSILSADFMHLAQAVDCVAEAGAGYIHVDVMDGHFVPNLTMGVPLVKCLKKYGTPPLDVHLMISNPLTQIPWFIDAGADSITVHAETLDAEGLVEAVEMIRSAGVAAAVSLKPNTPLESVLPVLNKVDMVLIMSVEPGFSGQHYIEGSERKVAELVSYGRSLDRDFLIEVDGGIDATTAPLVASEGADVLVCGNAVFATQDPAAALRAVQQAADEARLKRLRI